MTVNLQEPEQYMHKDSRVRGHEKYIFYRWQKKGKIKTRKLTSIAPLALIFCQSYHLK